MLADHIVVCPVVLRREAKEEHRGKGEFRCQYCFDAFKSKTAQLEHEMSCRFRPDDPDSIKCNKCPRRFMNKRQEREHRPHCSGRHDREAQLGLAALREKFKQPFDNSAFNITDEDGDSILSLPPQMNDQVKKEGKGSLTQHALDTTVGILPLLSRMINALPVPQQEQNEMLNMKTSVQNKQVDNLVNIATNDQSSMQENLIYEFLNGPVFDESFQSTLDSRDTRDLGHLAPKHGMTEHQQQQHVEHFLAEFFTLIRNKRASEESAIATLLLRSKYGTKDIIQNEQFTNKEKGIADPTFKQLILILIRIYITIDPNLIRRRIQGSKRKKGERYSEFGGRIERLATLSLLNESIATRPTQREQLLFETLVAQCTEEERKLVDNRNVARIQDGKAEMDFKQTLDMLMRTEQNTTSYKNQERYNDPVYIARLNENDSDSKSYKDRRGNESDNKGSDSEGRRVRRFNRDRNDSDAEKRRKKREERLRREKIRQAGMTASESESDSGSVVNIRAFEDEEGQHFVESMPEDELCRYTKAKHANIFPKCSDLNIPDRSCYLCGYLTHFHTSPKCPYFSSKLMKSKCTKCGAGAHERNKCKMLAPNKVTPPGQFSTMYKKPTDKKPEKKVTFDRNLPKGATKEVVRLTNDIVDDNTDCEDVRAAETSDDSDGELDTFHCWTEQFTEMSK